MAALLTVLSILTGVGIGYAKGGDLRRVLRCRPALWRVAAFGLALQIVLAVGWAQGGWATLVDVASAAALITFAVANLRIGGMVLVVTGLASNLVPTLANWGMPTSLAALRSAGIVTAGRTGTIELVGARHVATGDDWLRFLGETIALPTHQVISIGDVLLHVGYVLVVASVVRGRTLRRERDGDYPRRIAPLAMGPARRRGPGLHPSRLGPAMQHPSIVDRER